MAMYVTVKGGVRNPVGKHERTWNENGGENMGKDEISKAEACRNGLLMLLYRIEEDIDIAKSAEDFILLAEQCGKLSATCGSVAIAIARREGTQLKPLTSATKQWIRNLK